MDVPTKRRGYAGRQALIPPQITFRRNQSRNCHFTHNADHITLSANCVEQRQVGCVPGAPAQDRVFHRYPVACTACAERRSEWARDESKDPKIFSASAHTTMPRPAPSTFSKTADGRNTPASPRWGGPHGSGSSQGSPSTSTLRNGPSTSRRGVTAVSSPRANPVSSHSGAVTRGSSPRDPQRLRDGTTGSSERVGNPRKSIESDHDAENGREGARDDSGRIRVAVRVRATDASLLLYTQRKCSIPWSLIA